MSQDRSVILVVDDEESMRYFLEKALRREGYDVITARDGPEAIESAHRRTPDLVLADVRMPGMDGVALLRALRALHPRVPFVLMTAYGTVDDALSAMKQGATDYVLKPLRVEQVRDTVAKALRGDARAQTVRDAVPDEFVSAPPPPSAVPTSVTAPAPSARAESVQPARSATDAGTAPGNLVAFLRTEAASRSLPLAPELASGDLGLREFTRLCETIYVDELLRRTEGNVSRAAEVAGITRPNLHRKVVDLGLSADSYRSDG
ncbi:MAG: response regulator [Planctomycetes bacterium]|nr:response regulator [Planctomycetota bacterium]